MIQKINDRLPDGLRTKDLLIKLCMAIYPLDKTFNVNIKCAVEFYKGKCPQISVRELEKDIIRLYIKQGLKPDDEYVIFNLFEKDELEKQEYISLYELRKRFNKEKNMFPRNKYKRYLLFSNFFKREIIHITFNEKEEPVYQNFIYHNMEFILKPVTGAKGHGIYKIKSEEFSNLSKLQRISGLECMLEEVIQQGEELAKYHPSSVNTVRFVTGINPRGDFTYLYALLRVGRGGAIVDNVGSGGIVALIDIANGCIVSNGLCGTEYFEYHPDSQVKFIGGQIPAWSELCELVKKAHYTQPKQCLIGWDFAWTANGEWDLVEANPMPSFVSYQALTGKGIRTKLANAGLL